METLDQWQAVILRVAAFAGVIVGLAAAFSFVAAVVYAIVKEWLDSRKRDAEWNRRFYEWRNRQFEGPAVSPWLTTDYSKIGPPPGYKGTPPPLCDPTPPAEEKKPLFYSVVSDR